MAPSRPQVAVDHLLIGPLKDVVGQRPELPGVHLERVAGLVGRLQPVDVPQQERERAVHVALEPRGVHLGVERVRGRQRGARIGAEQAVPGARHRAARRPPGAESARRRVAVAEHGGRVGPSGRAASRAAEREQQRGVSLPLVDPHDVVRERRRAGEPAPDRPERLAVEELVEPDRMAGGQRTRAGAAASTAASAARRRRSERGASSDETLASRLAGEGEQQERLRVALLGERQADAERRADAAALGVAQQRVGPAAGGEPALGEAGEDDGVEAEAAELERREHGHAVAAGAAVRHARAGEQVAQHRPRPRPGRPARRAPTSACRRKAASRASSAAPCSNTAATAAAKNSAHTPQDARSGGAPHARARAPAAACSPRAAASRRRTASALSGDLVVLVVAGGGASRLEILQAPLQAAAAGREAGRPLAEPGHHPGLPGLVQPQRRLPAPRRRRAAARRRAGR